jgi:hypothetical protein
VVENNSPCRDGCVYASAFFFFRNCDFWLDVIRSARQEIAAATVGVDVGFTVKVDYMDIHCFARIRKLLLCCQLKEF